MRKQTENRTELVPLYAEVKKSTKAILEEIKKKTRKPQGHQIDEMAELYHKLNK